MVDGVHGIYTAFLYNIIMWVVVVANIYNQVLSMSRLGGAGAVAPVVADISSEVLLLL